MLQHKSLRKTTVFLVILLAIPLAGCHSILNAWLNVTELGSFTRESTLEIRGSLSIQDTPRGVRGATEPTADDLVPTAEEYRLVPGDAVNIFIFELRVRGQESAQQAVVDNRGMVNLPVIGWFKAQGLTARELEDVVKDILADRDIIHDAEVLVQFAAQRALTYTIFGNEQLAVRLNRGPGVFPIPRPDFTLLDALSVAGGLSELVSEIYVFRKTDRDLAQQSAIAEIENRDVSRDESGKTPTEGVIQEPPPLPSVAMSSGLRPASAALLGVGGQVAPDDGEVRSAPPDGPEEDPESAPDVQEIIDLMLADPATDTTEQSPEEEPATQATPHEDAVESPEPIEVAPPARWIFLNGEYVEVAPESPVAAAPPAIPTEERPIAPVIDWDEIAEERQAVRLIRVSPGGLRQGDPRYNLVVRPGDVIRLFSGDIGFYYMTGHVRRPGVFSFRSGATVTLKNAVAAAGGLDALGWPDRVTVYRRIADREQMIQVNLDRIYAGVEADFYLKKDDIVNFGTHPFAPFLIQIRNLTIPQLGGSITYFYRYVNQATKTATDQTTRFSTTNTQTLPGLFP